MRPSVYFVRIWMIKTSTQRCGYRHLVSILSPAFIHFSSIIEFPLITASYIKFILLTHLLFGGLIGTDEFVFERLFVIFIVQL